MEQEMLALIGSHLQFYDAVLVCCKEKAQPKSKGLDFWTVCVLTHICGSEIWTTSKKNQILDRSSSFHCRVGLNQRSQFVWVGKMEQEMDGQIGSPSPSAVGSPLSSSGCLTPPQLFSDFKFLS
ncbi:hypothetical protein AMECASPLE_030912 [Ameca splendens]|uniref:Uncharacterized protein n=1 Tax=Ameca splendens TaxID=208324 RepID=A0ABV0ZRY1_9TELE